VLTTHRRDPPAPRPRRAGQGSADGVPRRRGRSAGSRYPSWSAPPCPAAWGRRRRFRASWSQDVRDRSGGPSPADVRSA